MHRNISKMQGVPGPYIYGWFKSNKVRASMRAACRCPSLAGACGPPVRPTGLRPYGREVDPLERAAPSPTAPTARRLPLC